MTSTSVLPAPAQMATRDVSIPLIAGNVCDQKHALMLARAQFDLVVMELRERPHLMAKLKTNAIEDGLRNCSVLFQFGIDDTYGKVRRFTGVNIKCSPPMFAQAMVCALTEMRGEREVMRSKIYRILPAYFSDRNEDDKRK